MKKTIQKQIETLKKQIQKHDWLYYNLDKPEITDYEYDRLFKKLLDLEKKHPHLKTIDSPTEKIPGQALSIFKKASHSLPMLSLQNSYSKEEIKTFYRRISKTLDKEQLSFFLEPKLDGVAVELIYKKSHFHQALTRGDGKVGEDITENIKSLRGLPLFLTPQAPELLEIRGEVLLLKKDFKKINLSQEEAGLKKFANPRNLAAGSLRQLNPKLTASRPLYFFAHSLGLIKGKELQNQKEFIKYIKDLSIPTLQISETKKINNPLKLCSLVYSLKEILNYYDEIEKIKNKLPFQIDGIVIKVNDFENQKTLGQIARSPRWAIAGKFSPEQGFSQIKDIKLQIGRTGVITPVAILKPLKLGGVQIQQASLHNFKDLARKDLRIKDFVLVHRAGEVIPEVISPLKEKRDKDSKPFKAPSQCPSCQNQLKHQGDYLICISSQCHAIQQNKLIHFADKKAMNIAYLGKKTLKKFYQWGWLISYSDFYDLKNKNLIEKKGFGGKSYELLIKSIEKSKQTELNLLLFALGIPLIGEQTAQKISDKIYDLFEKENKEDLNLKKAIPLLKNITLKELEEIPDVGPLVAQSFHSAFKNQELIKDLERLHKKGLYFKKKMTENKLTGLKFTITGSFDTSREDIKNKIKLHGGQVLSQISQKTDFLLVGKKPGSKREKASKLNIKILNWKEFLNLI